MHASNPDQVHFKQSHDLAIVSLLPSYNRMYLFAAVFSSFSPISCLSTETYRTGQTDSTNCCTRLQEKTFRVLRFRKLAMIWCGAPAPHLPSMAVYVNVSRDSVVAAAAYATTSATQSKCDLDIYAIAQSNALPYAHIRRINKLKGMAQRLNYLRLFAARLARRS